MRHLALILVAPFLAGCSGGADYSDRTFESTAELVDVVEDTGMDCSDDGRDAEATRDALDKNGWTQEPCTGGTAALFVSDAKRDEVREKNLEPGGAWVQGGNWAVIGEQYIVEEAHESMGGELTHG